jgi:predicted alpha-1,6-mannanase (GH76 family)
VWDGLRVDPDGSIRTTVNVVYTYCQGVYLGACVELARIDSDGGWLGRAARTVAACAEHLAADGVLHCHGSGDGGLFTGILARYLALAAVELPATERDTRQLAARLVLASAQAAWRHRRVAAGGPVFGEHWSDPAWPPSRDLSVQLSGWMLCEAAALIERHVPQLG